MCRHYQEKYHIYDQHVHNNDIYDHVLSLHRIQQACLIEACVDRRLRTKTATRHIYVEECGQPE